MSKRMIWKTINFRASHDASSIESAWKSSSKAFGPNRTFVIERGGGGCTIETNIPVSGLRELFRHAGVRVDWRNGVLWDSKPSWEYTDDDD